MLPPRRFGRNFPTKFTGHLSKIIRPNITDPKLQVLDMLNRKEKIENDSAYNGGNIIKAAT